MSSSAKNFNCYKYSDETYKLLSYVYGIMKDGQLNAPSKKQKSKRKRFAEQKAIHMYNNSLEVSEKKKRGPHFQPLFMEYVLVVKDIVQTNNNKCRQSTVISIENSLHEIYNFNISSSTILRDLHSILKYKTGDRKNIMHDSVNNITYRHMRKDSMIKYSIIVWPAKGSRGVETDYHGNFDKDKYASLFERLCVSVAPYDNLIIHMNSAPCHKNYISKIPISNSKKAKIKFYLIENECLAYLDQSKKKSELLEIEKNLAIEPVYATYLISEKHGHTILITLPLRIATN
ncbi:hypothetical protein EDC96DRAFT_568905 [Choanephora cucurbitarum]|nr:hypothetical protein EDC96DRAFT_568905 [Choanephora cucurbitarum]